METLIFDTSAIFNFGHRGQLTYLLGKLTTQCRLVTTPEVQAECSRGPERSFYETFLSRSFEIISGGTSPVEVSKLSATIHPGEISVILLAAELKATAVLDDKVAQSEARKRGVAVTGTLGLIERGLKLHWLNEDQSLELVSRLRAGRFSIPIPGANETFAEYIERLSADRAI